MDSRGEARRAQVLDHRGDDEEEAGHPQSGGNLPHARPALAD
jgi:hypothetical protein